MADKRTFKLRAVRREWTREFFFFTSVIRRLNLHNVCVRGKKKTKFCRKLWLNMNEDLTCRKANHHHHHMSVMVLGHLLTRSGLTYLEVSSEVCHDSFCQCIWLVLL